MGFRAWGLGRRCRVFPGFQVKGLRPSRGRALAALFWLDIVICGRLSKQRIGMTCTHTHTRMHIYVYVYVCLRIWGVGMEVQGLGIASQIARTGGLGVQVCAVII